MKGKGKAAITKTGENDGTALHRSATLFRSARAEARAAVGANGISSDKKI